MSVSQLQFEPQNFEIIITSDRGNTGILRLMDLFEALCPVLRTGLVFTPRS